MSRDGLLLGIDAGGTSTRAVLATPDGTCVGYGRAGAGNPTSQGVELAAANVLEAVDAALAAAGATAVDVALVAAAAAGHDARFGVDWLTPGLSARGFAGRVVFESDLLAAYFSGTSSAHGYGVVCGTGASVIRVRDGMLDRTCDGVGWLLGDRGSGFWIGQAIARACVEELDGSGPATALTPPVLAHLLPAADAAPAPPRAGRHPELERLIRAVYAQPPTALAALAPLAFAAAAEGDAVAGEILRRAGEEVVRTFAAVDDGPGPVVCGGSILVAPGPARDAFRAGLAARGVGYAPIAVDDGATGAVVLALRHAGVAVDEERRERIAATLRALREAPAA